MKDKLRRFFHKFFKIFIIFMIGTLAVNIIIFTAVYINHRNKLRNEKGYLVPPGEMITVAGHELHVMTGGDENSENILVFMHSQTNIDDSIALEPLFGELKNCRYIYIDRSGYGFSESTGRPGTVEDILSQTRDTLKELGIDGPYTLVPMGTSGIEAFYWAGIYPDEVKAIIGINMNYPEQFEGIPEEQYCGIFEYLLVWACRLGAHRMISNGGPDNQFNIYTQGQMDIRRAIYGKGAYTGDMYNEALNTISNAGKTAALGFPEDIPMYLIYANPLMEPYINDDARIKEKYDEAVDGKDDTDLVSEYNSSIREYMEKHSNVLLEEMSGPDRLYLYDYKGLADRINSYIEGTLSEN